MPSGEFGNRGNNVTVLALADHDAGIETLVGLEVANQGKKLLVKGTQEHRPALLHMGLPGGLILDPDAQKPAIKPYDDKKENNKSPGP
jgi:hypothetical protein